MLNEPNQQLDTQVVQLLLKEMKAGRFKDVSVLPPEVDLANFFSVSRTTIREALATLEREGFISRKRKVGTLVNRHVLNIETRIDLEKEFLDIVKEAGYSVQADTVGLDFGSATEEEAGKLNLSPGDPVVHVSKIVYADSVPTIFCVDTIPQSLIRQNNYTEEDFKKPIFEFMEKFCLAEVYMAVSEVHAENATGQIAKGLQIPDGTAVLHLKEAEFDFLGIPILYSSEYYREGIITHTILRKRIH